VSRVREWFDDFAAAMIERSGREDFPAPGTEFWDDFERSLVRIGATWPHADEAASIVCDIPNLFPNNFRPMVVEAVKKIQAREQAGLAAGPGATTREDADLASRGCPDCGGSGFAHRYVHEDILGMIKSARGNDVPVGYEFSVPCSCALGHLAAQTLRKPNQSAPTLTIDRYPALRREPVEWTDSPDGLDNRHRYRPAHWDAAAGRPVEPEFPIRSVDDLRALIRTLAARTKAATSDANRRWLAEAEERRKRESPAVDCDPGPLPEETAGWF
jgi:hypothetical protein